MKARRCEEDRWDFDSTDGSFFPIGITKRGPFFSFCPGKATWDPELADIYRMLEIVYFTGLMPDGSDLLSQPDWFVDMLHTFLPLYDDHKFYQRQRSIWGSKDSQGKQGNGAGQGRSAGRPAKRPLRR